MSAHALLDLTRAKEFAPEAAQLDELLRTFEQSLANEITVIQAALPAGESLRVEHALHALKGYLPIFASPVLAQAVADAYQTSRDKPLAVTALALTALVPSLVALLDEVRNRLHPL